MAFLDTHAPAIIDHTVVVVFVAECALLWGDVVGYGWCPTNERLRLPSGNYKSRQTVYGALNILTGEPIVKALTHANTDATIAFIEMLRGQYANKRIVLIWDGATYHTSAALREYGARINDGTDETTRLVQCIRFAPNDPTQNPIETIWMRAKQYIRAYHPKEKTFSAMKNAFLGYIQKHRYEGKNMRMYHPPSRIEHVIEQPV